MTELKPKLIVGNQHTDERGTIRFTNEFDMSEVKRFYVIQNANLDIVRGWRGHRIEQRWFHVAEGEFSLNLVKIDNWMTPNKDLPLVKFILTAESNHVLHVPAGYASSIQATRVNSKLNVFADYPLDHAPNDNYLYESDYFCNPS